MYYQLANFHKCPVWSVGRGQTCGFKYLLTSRVNQDCLENLSSIIRRRGGLRDNPLPNNLHQNLDMLWWTNSLFKVNWVTMNCDKVLLHILSLTIYEKKQKVTKVSTKRHSESSKSRNVYSRKECYSLLFRTSLKKVAC